MGRGGRFGKYGDIKRKRRLQEARINKKIGKEKSPPPHKAKNR